jgi:hypothetical protein
MKTIGLLIGNGFTLDFSLQNGFDTRYPLQNFLSSSISYEDFIDKLANVKPLINLQTEGTNFTDFDIIEQYYAEINNDLKKDCELRRFLALSFSSFQNNIENYNMSQWKWVKWLQKNKKYLAFAISFNYDLMLENSLKLGGIKFYRPTSNEDPYGVAVLKPHGSIDFDLPHVEQLISPYPEAVWNSFTKLNQSNNGIEIVKKGHLLNPRFEIDMVPPSQENINLNLPWVQNCFAVYNRQVNQIDNFIIIGHSYSEPDRPEMNYFLERLNKKTKVFIIDIRPSIDLINKIESLGLKVEIEDLGNPPW